VPAAGCQPLILERVPYYQDDIFAGIFEA
jgi:hypothetical protein